MQYFNNSRRAGSPITTIKIYDKRDVDEIIFFDITATQLNREKIDIDFYKEITDECSVPITIGGGVNKIEHFNDLLFAGADKVSINSHLYVDPELLDKAANKYGSQTIVAGIDYKKVDNELLCFSSSGKKPEKKDPISWSKECADRGAGEIILTLIEYDLLGATW